MPVKGGREFRTESIFAFSREILTGQGKSKSAYSKNNDKSAHSENIADVIVSDSVINYF